MLQRLYATIWFTNTFGDLVMRELYDKDTTDAIIASLRSKGKHFKIEYEDA